jgi:8-oxo-dGTP pyrophosphatase MutT (NUDIX family)
MLETPGPRYRPGPAERAELAPAEPSTPRPAATIVLLRDGAAGPETLLLRRSESARFMPGKYVFPGGAVDGADADPWLLERADGLDDMREPEPRYRMAVLREALEEAGILLARRGEDRVFSATSPELAPWREALLRGHARLRDVVEALDVRLPVGELVYFAHWITPAYLPLRFDTRFFLAAVPADCPAFPDPREMVDAGWFTPAAALAAFRAGRLPMVLPTLRTLEQLEPFGSVNEALERLKDAPRASGPP